MYRKEREMDNFRTIANKARETFSAEDTLALLEEYAKLGCAMYPTDVNVVGLAFGYAALENTDERTADYVFHKCILDHGDDSYMVARAEQPNGKLTLANMEDVYAADFAAELAYERAANRY